MRVAFVPHAATLGGSQVSCLTYAVAAQRLGLEVAFCVQPGPLLDLARGRGLEVVELPADRPPSRGLTAIAGDVDVFHAFEVPGAVEAMRAARAPRRGVVASVMSSAVTWALPPSVVLTVSTPVLEAFTRQWWRRPLAYLPAPVDVRFERAPGPAYDVREVGLSAERRTVVLVSRLGKAFKVPGIRQALSAMVEGGAERGLQLLLVGGGPRSGEVAQLVAAANAAAGATVAAMTGELVDTRPAHRAAHVAVGLGTSVTRPMAAGVSGIVLGRRGYAQLVQEESWEPLLQRGFFGVGTRTDDDPADLLAALDQATSLPTADRGWAAGAVGRDLDVDRWAGTLEGLYAGAFEVRCGRAREELYIRAGWRAYGKCAAFLRAEARRRGMEENDALNWAGGTLRNLALPRSSRRPPVDLPTPGQLSVREPAEG